MENLFEFLEHAYRLKRTPRAGFWYYGVKDPETVAEHIFGVTLLVYILGSTLKEEGMNLDLEKALKMAVIHELGEALIGDIHLESRRYIGKAVDEGERKAFYDMVSKLPQTLRDEAFSLYKEFEEGLTQEAKLVRALDKLDLLLQAYIYEKSGYKNLENFFQEGKNFEFIEKIPLLREISKAIKERRKS